MSQTDHVTLNHMEAQAFSSSLGPTFEQQALVVLHQAYLDLCGISNGGLGTSRIGCPAGPIDMLFFYHAVAKALQISRQNTLSFPDKAATPPSLLNWPAAVDFASTLKSDEPKKIIRNFLVVASKLAAPQEPIDILFCAQFVAETVCREDVLARINSHEYIKYEIRKEKERRSGNLSWD